MRIYGLLVALLGIAILLPECAAQESNPSAEAQASSRAALSAAPSCCASPAEFRYEQIPADFEQRYRFGRDGPAFEFTTGKSFFRAFQLPEARSEYGIEITTRITDQGLEGRQSVLCPSAILLDDAFRMMAIGRNLPWVSIMPRRDLGYGLSTSIRISAAYLKARYLVLVTEEASLARRIKFLPSTRTAKLTAFTVGCNHEGLLGVKAVFPTR